MNKFGKRAFRTKSNAGMLGGATAALLLNCAGIIGTPFTGGGSLAATAAITGAGAGIG